MPLIVTLASAFALALVLGFVAARLRLPALVGYLLAGVLIGPHTPGFVADVALSRQLSEIGVMLLMFGVGLHFSLADLMSVKRVALPGAVVQMGVATALGAAVATWWGWPLAAALVFGVALSVASTVVLLRALEARGALDSPDGRIAVGWLVVEDLAMVLVLVLLPALAGGGSAGAISVDDNGALAALGIAIVEVALFIALMLVVGRRLLPWVLARIAETHSRELFTLCVMVAAIGVAYGASALFGVSVALGAFFAGLVLRGSAFGQRAAEESLPFRDAFAVLFFVSVGMLFDPMVLVERPGQVAATAAIIIVGKSVAAMALVLAFNYPLRSALTISASLAQIGEFSFILAALAVSIALLPPEAESLIVAGALISIALNPLAFATIEPVRNWLLRHSALARRLDNRDDALAALPDTTAPGVLARPVVLVGHGPVGERLARMLAQQGRPVIVVERTREQVQALREAGAHAVYGDPADAATLVQAHIVHADVLVATDADVRELRAMRDTARALNPALRIVALAATAAEAAELARDLGADGSSGGGVELLSAPDAAAQALALTIAAPCSTPAAG
jgi:CPA2 family monovalent cation:H+ antiporter-2